MLDKSKNYIVYCASFYGEDLAVRLLAIGFHVVAFLDNSPEKQGKRLLGRMVYSYQECREKYPEAIYIIANENWGTAYDIALEIEKDGYRHNDTYFIYQELSMKQKFPDSMNSWHLYLKDKYMVLMGEKYLCELFQHNLKLSSESFIICEPTEIEDIHTKHLDAFWIILTRGYIDDDRSELTYYSNLLQERGIDNFTGYFSRYYDYCIEGKALHPIKAKKLDEYKIDKILFLKSSSFSGSAFLNGIMTEHSNVLYTGYFFWTANIWTIVKKAAQVNPLHIVDYIAELIIGYQKKDTLTDFTWVDSYKSILVNYFTQKSYTEKEIFLYLHLAYYEYVNGIVPPPGNYVVYMDIHSGERICDAILSWLKRQAFQVVIIEMIRRPYIRLGSAIRYTIRDGMELPQATITGILPMMSMETVSDVEQQFPIVRIRFEDMKLYPADILKKLCSLLEIPWDNTLIEKVENSLAGNYVVSGNVVKGFDTKPVYYPYDEFFDAFDKFRLDMVFREKNKAYGYSYVGEGKYPFKPADDMASFFEIPFRFEEFMRFSSDEEKIRFRKKLAALCLQLLDMQGDKAAYPAYYNFGDYMMPETKS